MRPLVLVLALLAGAGLATQASHPTADAAVASFFDARTASESTQASERIAASGMSFDEVYLRLRQDPAYSREALRGVVTRSYRADSGEYFYTLDVPATYDPTRKYQVRIHLHGGVGRIVANAPPQSPAKAPLPGVDQIYVMPHAWRDAPWWSRR